MDVQQSPRESFDEVRGENSHEAGQDHEVRVKFLDSVGQVLVEGFAGVEGFVVHRQCRDVGRAGALQAAGLWFVADNCGDLCGDRASPGGVNQ